MTTICFVINVYYLLQYDWELIHLHISENPCHNADYKRRVYKNESIENDVMLLKVVISWHKQALKIYHRGHKTWPQITRNKCYYQFSMWLHEDRACIHEILRLCRMTQWRKLLKIVLTGSTCRLAFAWGMPLFCGRTL